MNVRQILAITKNTSLLTEDNHFLSCAIFAGFPNVVPRPNTATEGADRALQNGKHKPQQSSVRVTPTASNKGHKLEETLGTAESCSASPGCSPCSAEASVILSCARVKCHREELFTMWPWAVEAGDFLFQQQLWMPRCEVG